MADVVYQIPPSHALKNLTGASPDAHLAYLHTKGIMRKLLARTHDVENLVFFIHEDRKGKDIPPERLAAYQTALNGFWGALVVPRKGDNQRKFSRNPVTIVIVWLWDKHLKPKADKLHIPLHAGIDG